MCYMYYKIKYAPCSSIILDFLFQYLCQEELFIQKDHPG